MKKSILIIATVVFSFLNVNATNLKTNLNTTKVSVNITTDDLVQVYDWTVKTTTGEFSGTASSLFDAKRRANMVGQGSVVLEQKITNYFILRSEMQSKTNRVYFWEVKSERGYAKGFSREEFSAKRMINLVAMGDIISYKIIESKSLK
jgi:hypothetical protein